MRYKIKNIFNQLEAGMKVKIANPLDDAFDEVELGELCDCGCGGRTINKVTDFDTSNSYWSPGDTITKEDNTEIEIPDKVIKNKSKEKIKVIRLYTKK